MKENILKEIYNALEDKKARDIKIIEVNNVSTIADYIIVATGNNVNQVDAIASNVKEVMFKNNIVLKNTEGYASGGWILIDYCDIIINIFTEEANQFYNLDRVWKDGKLINIDKNEE